MFSSNLKEMTESTYYPKSHILLGSIFFLDWKKESNGDEGSGHELDSWQFVHVCVCSKIITHFLFNANFSPGDSIIDTKFELKLIDNLQLIKNIFRTFKNWRGWARPHLTKSTCSLSHATCHVPHVPETQLCHNYK